MEIVFFAIKPIHSAKRSRSLPRACAVLAAARGDEKQALQCPKGVTTETLIVVRGSAESEPPTTTAPMNAGAPSWHGLREVAQPCHDLGCHRRSVETSRHRCGRFAGFRTLGRRRYRRSWYLLLSPTWLAQTQQRGPPARRLPARTVRTKATALTMSTPVAQTNPPAHTTLATKSWLPALTVSALLAFCA